MGPAAISDAVNEKNAARRPSSYGFGRCGALAGAENDLQGCMPVVLGMGVRVAGWFVGEPPVPVLFDGCFVFGCP